MCIRDRSSDSALSELLVYPGEFDESFSPEVYEYHMTVGVETENVVLSAVPSDENAVVTADIPETLVIGENKATISVKALSGDESVYTVYITRLAAVSYTHLDVYKRQADNGA